MTFTTLLGTELPIIQAPMAGVQGSALAVAVCNTGALGSLPCAMLGPEALRDQLVEVRERTTGPFNVNFFCHRPPAVDEGREAAWRRLLAPYYEECGIDPLAPAGGLVLRPFDHDAADVLETLRPALVSFHFGLPETGLLARVKGWGSKIVGCATTVEEALWLEARGVDAVIAQGLEAGGHRGMFLTVDVTTQAGTFALLPQVVHAVSVPVIAAGGIADAAGVAAAMRLGAAGVQVGTAFLLCPEATTAPRHRAALASDAARHTALTNVFTGRPARSIVNRLVCEIGPLSPSVPDFPLATAALAALMTDSARRGTSDFVPLWCGQNATGCRDVPAAELVDALAAGCA